jgi:hypothetical protein
MTANDKSPEKAEQKENRHIFSAIQWVEILVTVIILGGLFWLGSQVVDIGKEVSSIKTKVDGTEQRIARISDSLPEDLKLKVAKNDLNKDFRFLILSGHNQLGQVERVDFVDIIGGKISSLMLKNSIQDTKNIEYSLAGFAEKNCTNPINLYKVQELLETSDVKNIKFKPDVDLINSYACQELKSSFDTNWLTSEEPKITMLSVREAKKLKLTESLKIYDNYKKILEPEK